MYSERPRLDAHRRDNSRVLPEDWNQLSYTTRVRASLGTVYLWGSAGITQNITFASPLLLHIRNDLLGEAISIGTATGGVAQAASGTLQPGECISLPLQNVTGVWATCALDSLVSCRIEN
jgi:hypothetical protein